MSENAPRLIEFPRFVDARGCLSVLDAVEDIPFPIRRVFFIEEMPTGSVRGDHAHYHTEELIIALGGQIEVTLESSHGTGRYLLGQSGGALYVPEMSWVIVTGITAGVTCMVLASGAYEERDYIRDRNEFRALIAP